MSTLGLSNLQSAGGVTTIPILNVNALYIGGVLYDEQDHAQDTAGLQAQINQINTEITQIEAITNRIDFTQSPLLVGNLVVTEANKNSVLLTAIQNLQSSIGALNKLDLSALPSVPAGACVITTPTTNQALKALIDGHDADIAKFNLTAMPAAPPASITITPATTNQALKALIDTINTSITNINAQIAHFSTFNYGADVMSGIADSTGFAVAVSGGSASGNGIFVYPNSSSVTEQIRMETAYDKEILIRGGNAVKIYGGNDGDITQRNRVEIGDATDVIALGVNHGGLVDFPEIEIGCDGVPLSSLDSSTTLKGDVYFSDQASTTGIYNVAPYTPVMVADTSPSVNFGNCNNFTTDPTFSGLDVLATAGIAPITLSAGVGNILVTAGAGLISLTALAGGITLATGAGIMTMNCGAGGFLLNSGAGVMNFAAGSSPINMTTASSDINLSAGQGTGGSAGNVVINPLQKAIIQPTGSTEIYKAQFVELNDNAVAPPITANRLYQQADALYWNGQLVQGGSGNQYVLKAGDTMTGTLNLPEAATSILTLTNLTTAPSPVTNRLYLLNNVLTFNGVAVGGGGGAFVPLAGGTMTGTLITPQVTTPIIASTAGSSSVSSINITPLATSYVNVEASTANGVPTFQVKNNLATSNFGAVVTLNNNKSGAGVIGDQLGVIKFQGKDSASAAAQQYASIQGFINDPTSTSKDGRLSTFVANNNTSTEIMRLLSETGTNNRRCNIASTYMEIGTNSIASTSTSTLTIAGTANVTTSLQTPIINNAVSIYPATSSTLVDGAVRQYRPERVYKLDDYPAPLTAPTMDGEKVFILNKTGTPAGLDQIWATADFPTIGGTTLSQVIQAKYVDKTASTPACNYVSTLYSGDICRVFVQADVPSTPLTMIEVCSVFSSTGNTGICDMVITCNGADHRLYFGGFFNSLTLTLAGGNVVNANNFSGQIVNTWASTGINTQTHVTMTSSSTTQDTAVGQTFSNIEGLNAIVNCLVDMTGNTSGFAQPTPPLGQKYDSIVIGGDFTGINSVAPSTRALKRISYYDWSANGLINTNLYSPTGLLPNQTSYFYSQLSGQAMAGSPNGSPTTTTYATISITATMEFLGAGVAPAPQFATCCGIIKDYLGNLYATGDSQNITATGSQQLYTFTFSNITLQGGNLGQGYQYFIQVTNINALPNNSVTYLADNLGNLISTGTGSQLGNPIGWRTFASSGWDTPVGADGQVKGGAGMSSGYIGFAFQGQTIIVAPQSAITSNYYFSMYYSSGSATFHNIGSDDMAIETGSVIIGQINCITGGNPTLAYGAGNAIAYGEIYLNRFTTNGTTNGLSFRYTSNDPYNTSINLILVSNAGIATSQLFPAAGEKSVSCWRNDAYFPNMYFIAMDTQTTTATLPWSQGLAPAYTAITLPASAPLPSLGFGGYSDEVGYQGLVIYGQFPPNGYLYKGANAGELVIDLTNCVVRTSGDTGSPVVALNKLTFPAGEDGTSIMLLGDTSTSNPYNKASWWAVSQDGIVVFDTTTINSRGNAGGGGITSVTTQGSGLSSSTTNNQVILENTGVTSIIAGSNISISGATGAVTINSSGAGVTSLSIPTPATGNQQPLYLQPFQSTTGALTLTTQPTKAQFFANFSGFGEYGQLNVVNGQSIFLNMNGADASGRIPATPVSFFQNISPFAIMTNTSVYFKFTCSLSFAGEAGWNPATNYLYLNFLFTNTSQQQTQYAQGNIQGEGGVAATFVQDGTSTLRRMNATWSDVFSVAAQEGTSNQIMLSNQFRIGATTNYTFQQNLTGTIYWELEYIPNP
jgi:hypothetical protein